MLAIALIYSVEARHETILRILLAVDGEEGRAVWANTNFTNLRDRRLLHIGARFCYPAAVSTLLGAGAEEEVHDSEGRTPRDVIGVGLGRDSERQIEQGKELEVRRMLQRGPAY